MNKSNKDAICAHIREYAQAKGIHLLNVNGWKDHLHTLFSLTTSQNVETVLNLIKGQSSFWANRNLNWSEKFHWQDEYFAVTISQSDFHAVNDYINRQELHHQSKTFAEEYEELMKEHGIKEWT
jgi:REP element-mobilizing transposase RayT